MKKVIPAVIVLAAIAAVAFVFLKRAAGHHLHAAQLAPAQSILFVHLPDLRRTAQRWPATGLAQIWQEPEVQAFLAKPRTIPSQWTIWQEKLDRIAKVEPGEAFVALTSIEGPQPKFVAGFSFSGKRAEVEALLAEPRAELKRAQPAGKSDIERYGATEIETFTFQETKVGEAFFGDWYFVANSLELLHSTLDIAQSGRALDTALSDSGVFKNATARVPADGDLLLVAQLATVTDRLVSLLAASGQAPDAKQLAELKKIEALALGTKLEGTQIRDTIFLLSPGGAKEPPLARNALAFSAPETFLYYATALPASFDLPPSALAMAAFLPGFSETDKALTAKGLKWSDLGAAFGPEFGVLADWAQNAPQPAALLAVDVRDAAKAKAIAEAFTGGVAGSPAWGREENGGVTFFQSPAAQALPIVRPAIAVAERFVVAGLSLEAVKASMQRHAGGQPTLARNSSYEAASKTVGTPTSGFAYLDLKVVFERSYAMIRPLIAMSLAFNPDAGQYVDASKLPSTEAISRHLTPSIFSQSVSENGTLIESSGTLTLNQALIGAIGGAAASAFPLLQNAFASGMKLDPKTFQLTPGAPAAPPAVQPAPSSPAPRSPAPLATPAPAPPAGGQAVPATPPQPLQR